MPQKPKHTRPTPRKLAIPANPRQEVPVRSEAGRNIRGREERPNLQSASPVAHHLRLTEKDPATNRRRRAQEKNPPPPPLRAREAYKKRVGRSEEGKWSRLYVCRREGRGLGERDNAPEGCILDKNLSRRKSTRLNYPQRLERRWESSGPTGQAENRTSRAESSKDLSSDQGKNPSSRRRPEKRVIDNTTVSTPKQKS